MGLFNSTILDVAIGLVFVYLLLAILCTAANEWASALTRRRGAMLKKGIRQLLDKQPFAGEKADDAFLRSFDEHPMIRAIKQDKKDPAYLSSRAFATVVLDLVNPSATDFVASVNAMPPGDVQRALLALINQAKRRLVAVESDDAWVQTAIEGWFNDAMDRVSGWYKRRTQIWTVAIALALTIVANADTVQISRRLWTDPVLRSAVVEEAKERAKKPPPTISVEYEDDADPTQPTVTRTDGEGNQVTEQERQLLGQLLGWRGALKDNGLRDWLERVLGWILTVLALSMGAPFWFDLLNKFMNVRYTGKSPDEKPKTPEKDAASVRA